MSRLRDGLRTFVRGIKLWLSSLGVPGAMLLSAACLILALVLIALASPAIRSQIASLGGAGPSTAETPASDEPAADDALSGTWRVFKDDSESQPLFDLTFEKGGAAVPLVVGGHPYTVKSWTYSEEGDAVEVDLTCHAFGNDGGEYTWQVWLHMTRNGDEMRGSADFQNYIYEGIKKGTTYGGVTTYSDAAFARPK